MSDSEVVVTRETGYVITVEVFSQTSVNSIDRVGDSIKEVAMYVIDNFEYYLGNDEVKAIEAITMTGGAASLEIHTEHGIATLTVFRSTPEVEQPDTP